MVTQLSDAELHRNTSTDVEKTRCLMCGISPKRKHLHGRGEDVMIWPLSVSPLETPPLTWRRQLLNLKRLAQVRNTSTDVEKTQMLVISRPSPPGNTSTDVEKTLFINEQFTLF